MLRSTQLGDRAVGPAEPRDEQPAAGCRKARADLREQGDAFLPGGEHDGDVLAVRRAPAASVSASSAVVTAANRVVGPVAPRQLGHDPAALGGIVVGDHEQGVRAAGDVTGAPRRNPTAVAFL